MVNIMKYFRFKIKIISHFLLGKIHYPIFLLFFIIINSTKVFSQNADSILSLRNEIFIYFKKPAYISIEKLTRIMSIHSFKNDTIKAFLNKEQFENFRTLNINYKIINPSTHKKRYTESNVWDWNRYPTYNEYLQIMDSLAKKGYGFCELIEAGRSVKNRKILFLRINNNKQWKKPSIMLSGTIHGNEPAGLVLLLRMAQFIINKISVDGESFIGYDIWINPLINPDGLYFDENDVYQATRNNANGVDLNRNFPDPVMGPHPDNKEYQPETKAIMKIFDSIPFLFSVTFHSGEEVVNYPWDCKPDTHPDNQWFRYLAKNYVYFANAYGSNDYFKTLVNPSVDSTYGITRGYAWYPIYGGRQDYACFFKHCREFTIEIDKNLITPEENLQFIWNANYLSILKLMNNAAYPRINGKIENFSSLKNTVRVELIGHDDSSSVVFSNPYNGYFYRPVFPGTYYMKLTCPQYKDTIIGPLEINFNHSYYFYFYLFPNDINNVNNCSYTIYPNPVNDYIVINSQKEKPFFLNLYNISGLKVFSSNKLIENSIIDLKSFKPGIYWVEIVNIKDNNKEYFKIIKQ